MSGLTRNFGAPATRAASAKEAARPLGLRAAEAVYCAFLVSIPIETIIYFQSDQSNPGSGVSLSRLVGAALLAVAAVQWRTCFRRLTPAFWLIVWYLAFYALAQLWIPVSLFASFHAEQLTLAQLAVLFVISINLLADPGFRKKALRLYGWWMAIVALGLLLGVFGAQLDEESRDTIAAQDPNVAAALLSTGALCLAGDEKLLARGRSAARAALSLGAIAVMMAAVLRTGSRGGLIAFVTGFVALAACAGGLTRRARVAVAAIVLGLGAGLLEREFALRTNTAARLERSWDEGDTAGRTEIYDEAWRMFLRRPALGYGGLNNRFVLGANLNYPDRDTHNVFLAVLTEVGLAGGAGFFLALLYGVINAWRGGRRTGDALPFALMCAMLVISTSITASQEKIFWVVLAAAVAAGQRSGAARAASEAG